MKRLRGLFAAVFLGFAIGSAALAADFDGVYDKYQVVYSPTAKVFSTGGMAPDRLILTKKVTGGTGSYSEYYVNGKKVLALGSNFEFVKDGQLVACHNADLKYYKVVYANKKFSETPMTQAELQKMFPNAEIIKISQFKDGVVTVKKPLFSKKEILLVNDTKQYFHKYSYKPSRVQKTDVLGLANITLPGKIKFSHYGENNKEFPMYTINTKLILKK